jgi:hypothetical protein
MEYHQTSLKEGVYQESKGIHYPKRAKEVVVVEQV